MLSLNIETATKSQFYRIDPVTPDTAKMIAAHASSAASLINTLDSLALGFTCTLTENGYTIPITREQATDLINSRLMEAA